MNSEPNVPAKVMRLVLLAQPYVGTDWVDLGTEEEEVPVQQGGTWTGIIGGRESCFMTFTVLYFYSKVGLRWSKEEERRNEECIRGCNQEGEMGGCNQEGGGSWHKKPTARQEIRMKADEEEEEENARRGEDKRNGRRWAGGLEGSVNWGDGGGGEGSRKRWVGGERGLNWGGGEEVSTITLHVTEHTVTVRLEARYRPSSNL